jgi:hypothetical protein
LFTVDAERPVKYKEGNRSNKDDPNQLISHEDMKTLRSTQRYDAIQKCFRKSRDREAGHGKRNQGHLKKNCVFRTKYKRWNKSFQPVTRRILLNRPGFRIVFDQSIVDPYYHGADAMNPQKQKQLAFRVDIGHESKEALGVGASPFQTLLVRFPCWMWTWWWLLRLFKHFSFVFLAGCGRGGGG